MYFVFDTETTGLPKGHIVSEQDVYKYDNCRIVSICWIVLDSNLNEIDKQYFVIRPDGFKIPAAATAIHGITDLEARTYGISISDMLFNLNLALSKCDTIVAHNINFDFGALLSESYRAQDISVVNLLFKKERFCTMQTGKNLLGLKKLPKLGELYKELCAKEMTGAHNARVDTECCSECFKKIMNSR